MTTNYDDITDDRPRINTYEENGYRTTSRTTRLGPDPNEKPKETVSVRTIQHPDSTETVTVTEKRLPPIRYTEKITREKLPTKTSVPQIQVTQSTPVPITTTTITNTPPKYNIIRRERLPDNSDTVVIPSPRQDRLIVTQGDDRIPGTRTIIREPTPATRSTRIVEVRQPSTPVIVDVATPPVTRTKTTRIINDTSQDTIIDDRRTLVNYQDDYYGTRRTGRRTDWCGQCGADCCGCDCFADCCGPTNCCRTNSFARRKDVVSYRTRVTRDGRRVRYRVSRFSIDKSYECFMLSVSFNI